MKTKLIIFDLDGVLVDACEWHRQALNEALQEVCDYQISLSDHYSTFNGLPTKVKLQKLFEMGHIKKTDFIKIENIKQEKTVSLIQSTANIRPEKIELMKLIKDKNIKLACYTNSIRSTAFLMLKKTGIIDFFDLIMTNQDVRLPKPDPEGYNLCMAKFNITPDECLIVEDSPKGIEAAQHSKARIIQVRNPDDVTKEFFCQKGVL